MGRVRNSYPYHILLVKWVDHPTCLNKPARKFFPLAEGVVQKLLLPIAIPNEKAGSSFLLEKIGVFMVAYETFLPSRNISDSSSNNDNSTNSSV